MMRKYLLILVALAVSLLLYLASSNDKVSITTSSGVVEIDVEVADSAEEREKGLMFRNSLDHDNGMLFIFKNEETRSFWMKNTLIPLDIIFIDRNLKIVDMQAAKPCVEHICSLYTSEKPAQYVLEVNQGFVKNNGISIGDLVRI